MNYVSYSRSKGNLQPMELVVYSMEASLVVLLVLLSPYFTDLSESAIQDVYISPNGSCPSSLSPCYSLSQLNTSGNTSVAVKFLPGTFMIQDQLQFHHLDQLVMSPLSEEDEVVIQCNHLSDRIHALFADGTMVSLSFLHFNACSLKFDYTNYDKNETFVSITECTFEKSQYSGAISFSISITITVAIINVSNSNFLFNSGAISTQLGISDSTDAYHLTITNSTFQCNTGYGAITIVHTLLVVKDSRFLQNTADYWRGAIAAYQSSSLSLSHTLFYKNYAPHNGGALYLEDVNMLHVTNCSFLNNSAGQNGAIYMQKKATSSSQAILRNNIFQGNNASEMGGAIYAQTELLLFNCQFKDNSAHQGGALYLSRHQSEYYSSKTTSCSFVSNKAEQGGAVYCKDYSIDFYNGYSSSNSAQDGGALYQYKCEFHSFNHTFSSNKAANGGGVYAEENSKIELTCTNFTMNVATQNGGGIYLKKSLIYALPGLTFDQNIAHHQGGAVFVSDEYCQQIPYNSSCFIRYFESVTFSNNSAREGEVLYGGLLDRCCVSGNCSTLGIDYFKRQSIYDASPSAITSDPVRMCLCNEKSEVDCAIRRVAVDKWRGQTIKLTVVLVDQDSKAKAGFVQANYMIAEYGQGEGKQKTGNYCTTLTYHVITPNTSAVLALEPEGVCEHSSFSRLLISINIVPCPLQFKSINDRCVCDPRLKEWVTSCDVDIGYISKTARFWFHYDQHYLKVHAHCPLEYCAISSTVNLSLQNEQCANHRNGVICGSCQDNYSIALGGSKCLDCSSSFAYAWLIPVFAVAGIALVTLLLVCNMTVSHGTLNGLIFYANVVSISRLTSFQDCSVHPLLSVFIAWINLDFGVGTCFYPGMDTYQKTWLQFVFPLYIWILVGAIILISHYSSRAMKMFGKNNIAVLATLFLLSYTKLLKTIITALNFTQVLRGSASNTSDPLVPYNVWIYDGNIEYLNMKHLPLFAIALAFLVFVFLPYTLLLTFGQCIRSIRSRNKCVLWCIRSTAFVSIMDAYHAPYTNRHRYWTGFMILVRCFIFLIFIANFHQGDGMVSNMYKTLLCLIVVFTLKAGIPKVFKSLGKNLLELIFLLNLAILCASVLYFRRNDSSEGTMCNCINASISISLAMFVGILVYHTYLQMLKSKKIKSMNDKLLVKRYSKYRYKRMMPADDDDAAETTNSSNLPTISVVELREELLESN